MTEYKRQMLYNKEDAVMTKGLAILCMLILHLFCRTGKDVYGTPLIWINETTPLVFYFGFFAEICVPIYSLCAGYAQQYMSEQKNLSWKKNLWRAQKLLINYWIVLVVFCILGLSFDADHVIPGSLSDFLKSVVLLHSYNGAWWYLNTYVLLMLIPPKIILWPISKLKYQTGLLVCLFFQIGWYIITRFGIILPVPYEMQVAAFIEKEAVNLFGIMPYVWAGAFICKGKVIERCNEWMQRNISLRWHNTFLMLFWGALFLLTNLIHKAALFGVVGVLSFLIFNLLKKSKTTRHIFVFIGKHSTNIWLTHMFFYLYLFKGLVMIVKYPIFMLIFMIILCVGASYVIMGIERVLYKLLNVPNVKQF